MGFFIKEFIIKDNSNKVVHNNLFLNCFLTSLTVVKVIQLELLLSETKVDHEDRPDEVQDAIRTSAFVWEI